MDGKPEYVDMQEFARITGVSLTTVRRWVKGRKIVFWQPGGARTRVIIPRNALELSSLEAPAPDLNNLMANVSVRPGRRPMWLGRR
jgi:excisionase family DNA binding protein